MTAWIISKIVGRFLMKNWRAFVVASVLGSALWVFCDWRGQKELIAAQRYELKAERQLTRQWRDVSRLQSAKAKEAADLRDEFERKLAEELAKPPKLVFEPAEPEIIEIIKEAKDCPDAISKLGAKLKELLERRTP